MLVENKKSWDSKLVYALWADQVSNKKSIGTSPFQLVYGVDVFLLVQLDFPMMKLLQEEMEEPYPIQWRMLQLIEVHQIREALIEKAQIKKDKVKVVFNKRERLETF